MENYEITLTPLVYEMKIYHKDRGENSDGRTRYSTSMLLTDLGLNDCRLHLGHGVLNNDINNAVFVVLQDLGYEHVQFEVPEGTDASRLATYVKTKDGLDRYTVSIQQETS